MNYMVIGGAGFIGSHVTKRLISEEANAQVFVFDTFSSGKKNHLEKILKDEKLPII